MEPDEQPEQLSQCDCCGLMKTDVCRSWTSCGIETFACEECSNEGWK